MKGFLRKLSSTSIGCPDIPDDIVKKYSTVEERLKAAVEWNKKFCPGRMWTLEEVAQVSGVTRERIRQIEYQALRKIRNQYLKICRRDGLDPETLKV